MALAAVLLAAAPARGESFRKGSFTHCTAGGGPCDDVVAHGLGETPKALILWTNGKTNESFSGSFLFGFGVTDGTTSRSVAAASQDAQGKPNASRRMAAKALVIVEWGEFTRATADLLSWDQTNFTLRWTPTNTNVAYVIHFIAIGGGEVSAKVVDWQMPTSPDPAFPVAIIGFKPDVVLHAHAGDGFRGALDTNAQHSAFGLGVMAAGGDQWATGHFTVDGANNGADADTQRGQQTDSCIFAIDNALGITKEASFVSMDTNGFTLNFTTANGNASQIFSLALKGISARAGSFDKVTAGSAQTVADVGFRPGVVLLSSFQDVARANPVANSHFGIGASDGTLEGSSAFQDTDAGAASVVDGIDKTSKVFVKVNNSTPSINAEADLTGFFNGGFTLNWTTNDAVATQMLYLALGQQSEAKVLSGSYTGNGADNRAIAVGFVPDFVIVKGDTTQTAVFRTSTMVGDSAKPAVGATALAANLIQSFDVASNGGFTVGTDARVNSNGVMYYWTAFKAGPGRMAVGSYVGTGAAATPVTGLAFSPELAFVMSADADSAIQRSSASNENGAYDFYEGVAPNTTSITLGTDGFSVGGTDVRSNRSGTVYHWVAWNKVAGYMDVGSYQGNGVDNRDLTVVGFESEYLLVKGQTAWHQPQQRSASMGASTVERSAVFHADIILCCRIQQLLSNGFQVSQQFHVNENSTWFTYYAWKRQSQPLVISGDYTGTGAAQSVVDIGFMPDVVIVKGDNGETGVIRTSTMTGSNAKPIVGATGLTGNLITSLDVDGFTVGTHGMVNVDPVSYYWIAFKAAAGTMKVGTYLGNGGGSSMSITGVGFSPELVFIISEGTAEAIHLSSASTAAHNFANSAGDTTWITSLNVDGFTVGTNSRVNGCVTCVFHYVAWNEVAGEMDVGSYVGNSVSGSNDDRNIGGVRFEPEYVIVKRLSAFYGVHHPASLGRSNDSSLHFHTEGAGNDRIQALQPDGFQIGTTGRVNEDLATYVYYAWKRPHVSALTAVRLTAFQAARYARGVLAEWRTGYEVDNLGFHLYREVDGARTRVTRSLVAGSGLMAGQGTAVNAEQRYALWDLEAAAADPAAVYWLEDVDFNGTSTWHGPVTPVDGGLQDPPDVAPSTSLRELGKGAKRRGKTFLEQGARLERARKPGARVSIANETETQWALAARSAVKIGISRPGWYRATQPELVAAGLDPHVNPRLLRLFIDGVEQSMTVSGEADGRFDPADAIELYGAGADTPYTDTRTYWLVADSRPGRRATVHGRPSRAAAPTEGSFAFTVQQKDRSIYFAALRNGDEGNWFGEFIYEEPTDLTVNVSNLDPAGAAELEVVLQGVTADAGVNPDHQVAVLLNGTELGEVRFDGRAKAVQTFAIPAGVLVEGTNTVTVVSRGGEADYSLVDVMRLHYAHTYRADADLLRFTSEGKQTVTITGFASNAIRVVDITDPLAPEELRGAVAADRGLWAVTVRLTGNESRTLLAFTDATVARPAFVRANIPSRWHAAVNAADYVAVSHAAFVGAIGPLLERRGQQGLSTALVDIEDVYDEFSFGEKTPQALKDFVTHARATWKQAPRFLLLVGDATVDPRDYAGFGDADFIPTKEVPMAQIELESASDDWFADADDDGLPELAVGRLSVRTGAQAEGMVAKILEYEDSADLAWTRDVLLVADRNDGDTDFERATAALGRLVPADYTARQVLSGRSGPAAARRQLLDAVNQGQLIVNYIGHGSVRVWGTEGILTAEDVTETWHNDARLPFIVAMNCLNGFFHGIYDEESLAETLLRVANGGAVAAWASSGLTESATQARVNQELFRVLFAQPALTIGEAVAVAKRAVTDRDLRRSWIFFGDPALRLKGMSPTGAQAVESSAVEVAVGASIELDRGPSTDPSSNDATHDQVTSVVRLADFTGDGRDDVWLYAPDTGAWAASFSDADTRAAASGAWGDGWQISAAWLNDDAVADLFFHRVHTGEWMEATSVGPGRFTVRSGAWAPGQQVLGADVNGDGRDDRLAYEPRTGILSLAVRNGSGTATEQRLALPRGVRLHVADFNGDSRADLFGYDHATGRGFTALNRSTDFSVMEGSYGGGWQVTIAQLNDDGRSDLTFYDPISGRVRVGLTDRAGTLTYRDRLWAPGLTIHAADLDADGRDDLFGYNRRTGMWMTAVLSARGFVERTGTWAPGWEVATADLNGDGRIDIVLYDPVTGLGFRCLTVADAIFMCSPEQWAPDGFFVGRRVP